MTLTEKAKAMFYAFKPGFEVFIVENFSEFCNAFGVKLQGIQEMFDKAYEPFVTDSKIEIGHFSSLPEELRWALIEKILLDLMDHAAIELPSAQAMLLDRPQRMKNYCDKFKAFFEKDYEASDEDDKDDEKDFLENQKAIAKKLGFTIESFRQLDNAQKTASIIKGVLCLAIALVSLFYYGFRGAKAAVSGFMPPLNPGNPLPINALPKPSNPFGGFGVPSYSPLGPVLPPKMPTLPGFKLPALDLGQHPITPTSPALAINQACTQLPNPVDSFAAGFRAGIATAAAVFMGYRTVQFFKAGFSSSVFEDWDLNLGLRPCEGAVRSPQAADLATEWKEGAKRARWTRP